MQVNQAGRRGKMDGLSREVLQTENSVVTTNCEKSAEDIVLRNQEGSNNSRSNGLKAEVQATAGVTGGNTKAGRRSKEAWGYQSWWTES